MIGTHKSVSSMQLKDAIWMMEATTSGSQIALYCTNATINTQKAGNVINTNPFGSTDYWYPCWLQGKCGSYIGQYSDLKDASTQLKWAASTYIKLPSSGYYYYTDYYNTGWFLGEPGSTNFYFGPSNECLTPTTMNALYNGLADLIDDNKPINRLYVSCIFEATTLPGKINTTIAHIVNLKYGIRKKKESLPEVPFQL